MSTLKLLTLPDIMIHYEALVVKTDIQTNEKIGDLRITAYNYINLIFNNDNRNIHFDKEPSSTNCTRKLDVQKQRNEIRSEPDTKYNCLCMKGQK